MSEPPIQPPVDPPYGSEIPPSTPHRKKIHTCRPDQTPWWKYLLEVSAVLAAFYVAFVYSQQLLVMRGTLGEMKRSGEQSTEQVWRAIDNMNWMARSMDWSQKTTRQGIEASERENRDTLNVATENARSDMRAYIVVDLEPYRVETCYTYPPSPCAFFHYVNVGRTPAVNVEVSAYLHIANASGGGGVGEQTIKDLVVPSYSGLRGTVMGNNASPATGTAHWDGKPILPPCGQPYHGVCGHSIYGLIRYKDIFAKEHETGFCLYIPDRSPDKPSFCDYGNWFDVRPKGYHIHELQ